ncbi:uncharacterized protein LOC127626130 [Xyrauchen texanus]|uniref:uncharacterized protein LOC127626130 n=1 Tax=Xyrauchen texanus TaxID=154827 RepID=UPI002241CA03|nr:uncharacterized protein LOC127626130 [Xyrauchen texanus]
MCDRRSVLMQIPEPQAKITAVRRSYMDILGSRPAADTRSRRKHTRALDAGSHRRWTTDPQRDDVDTCQTSGSKQLLNSLILAEQSVQMVSSSLASDLKILLDGLQQKKISVYRSIPYSRLGSNRDAHCFRKARPHLLAFKRSCREGGVLLLQNSEWEILLEFVVSACRLTSELPQWDTSIHNTLQQHCFNTLAEFCTAALQKHTPAARRARQLLHRFKAAAVSSRGVCVCLEELEKILHETSQTQTDPSELKFSHISTQPKIHHMKLSLMT